MPPLFNGTWPVVADYVVDSISFSHSFLRSFRFPEPLLSVCEPL